MRVQIELECGRDAPLDGRIVTEADRPRRWLRCGDELHFIRRIQIPFRRRILQQPRSSDLGQTGHYFPADSSARLRQR